MTDFSCLGLSRPIVSALEARQLTAPTPIQEQTIPHLISGRDVLGLAQTGSGKTAAFVLPLLQRLATTPSAPVKNSTRALILSPTRELASQSLEQVNSFGKCLSVKTGLTIGGASIQKQKASARRGFDILVATPGRLFDLLNQGSLSLRQVEYFVLDEVDQMLDLGFIDTIRRITAQLPKKRQNVFFSATMAKPIEKFALALLDNPIQVRIASGPKPKIAESVIHLMTPQKPAKLIEIANAEGFVSGLVFTRTKRGADRVAKALNSAGLKAHPIHGNRSQPQRERALSAFRSGRSQILVATDIAARGIDVTGVSHVINYDLPATPETYVHRIGRTGRAGASGIAVSFCSPDEEKQLRAVERLTGRNINATNAPSAPQSALKHQSDKRKKQRSRHKPKAPLPSDVRAGQSENKSRDSKDSENGERGYARNRRRRNRGSPRQKLQGAA
ncbi:MAG: DEAD/DEAH box helicase [Pseudomonadota bacterium]